MFCGSCLHDNTLVRQLHRLGVDIHLIPTYTPIRTDEQSAAIDRVFFGGINVYLEQKVPLFRYLPAWLTTWLDRPGLLRWATSAGIETDARQLGSMTLSMLRGRHGFQRKEVRKLVRWLHAELRPDLIVLTNSMLAGCLPALKETLPVPVLVNLQGDDAFLDNLVEPFRTQVLDRIRELMVRADGFLVNSRYYAEHMAAYLDLPAEKLHQVPLGIDVDGFARPPVQRAADGPPVIGYLARLTPAKGLHLLVDALLRLHDRRVCDGFRLQIAGWLGKSDEAYAHEQFDRLRAAGLEAAFTYAGTVDRAEKIAFLHGLDLLCVPTTYREPKGLYVLEALAAGVPVVQPAHGAFPELLGATGGGRLTTPHDPEALADAIAELLADPDRRRVLGQTGQQTVLRDFNADAMARQTLAVYRQFV
jgi:glycosyltransferase involved in cell wall biosynthesis